MSNSPFVIIAQWVKDNVPKIIGIELDKRIPEVLEDLSNEITDQSEATKKALQDDLSKGVINVQQDLENVLERNTERLRGSIQSYSDTLIDNRMIDVENTLREEIEDGVDGKSLEFVVKGDRVGIRQEGSVRYAYTSNLTGESGKDGLQGKDGKDGLDGKDGKDGKDGLDAYEVAKQEGFKGSREDWLESLQGEAPEHRWVGSKLQFKNPDGSWGKPVNIMAMLNIGGGGGTGGSSFDPDTLPTATVGTEWIEVIVKQSSGWVRMGYDDFIQSLPKANQVYAGDDEVMADDINVVAGD